MIKLSPPILESSLPSFCDYIRIPFTGSPAVSFDNISGVIAQIKDIQSNVIIGTADFEKKFINPVADNMYEIFANIGQALEKGRYYKIQLAYYLKDAVEDAVETIKEVGHFSDVGIIKYIAQPRVDISVENIFTPSATVTYKCVDLSERLYSIQFFLIRTRDLYGWTSGEIIHNTKKDVLNSAAETYTFNQSLDNDDYEIYAIVKTTSGYTIETEHVKVNAAAEIPMTQKYNITAELDYDNGCVNIGVYAPGSKASELRGKVTVLRADSAENYSVWHNMTGMTTDIDKVPISEADSQTIWRDFTVEQGRTYKYAIQGVDSLNNVSAKEMTINPIYVDFEDSFLFDGERQLKIRFNPKVSSFKTTLQETKIDTIGSKYPYFSRNGNTGYREFSISGLLSHLSDEKGYFNVGLAQSKELEGKLGIEQNYTTNLNGENVMMERQFKIDVLDWLNNGKPKLFRSPTEGNFFVRLMNVSLTPNDTLGRMLHTFTATAYELGPCTPEELGKNEYKILRAQPLDGIAEFESQRGTYTYKLNTLANSSDKDLIKDNPDIKGTITGASFYCQYNPSRTVELVINDKPVNVYNNRLYDGEIYSIKKGNNFAPGDYDIAILSYRNVLSLDMLNEKIQSATTTNDYQQWFNFDLSSIISGIKNFFSKIYQIICKIRDVIVIAIEKTYEAIRYILKKIKEKAEGFVDLIKSFIKKCVGEFHESCIYKFVSKIDNKEVFCGFFDGFSEEVFDNGNENNCFITCKFFNNIKDEVIKIKDKLVIKGSEISENIKNIIANPFVCIEMIYRKQENFFSEIGLSNGGLSIGDCHSGQGFLGQYFKNISISLNQQRSSTCNIIWSKIKESLTDGKILGLDASTVINTIQDTGHLQDKINNTTDNAIRDFLGSGTINDFITNTKKIVKKIVNISKDALKNTFNSLSGLFGGVLC